VLFFYLLLSGHYILSLLALAAGAFDMIDGEVARSQNKVTAFGGLLDSTLDRLADTLLISAFGFASLVRWELVVSLLTTSYLISYIRSRAELAGQGKFILAIGIIERGERLLGIGILVSILLFLPQPIIWLDLSAVEIGFVFLLILSIITVYQRFLFSYHYLQNKQ